VRKIIHFVTRLAQPVHLFGWPDGILYLASKLLTLISMGRARIYKYYFVAQPVIAEPLIRRAATDVRIRKIGHGDAWANRFPRPAHVIADRYRQGACLAACKADELLGYAWIVFDRYEEDEVRCVFMPSPSDISAWDFDVYVDPKYRLGRTFSRLWDAVNTFLRERGYNWTISRISAFNKESLTSHGRLGATGVGSALFFQCGFVQVMISSCRPYFHLSTGKTNIPTLCLWVPTQRSQIVLSTKERK
jgi:GNAT superfamily N-acetyltransferase